MIRAGTTEVRSVFELWRDTECGKTFGDVL